MCVGWGQRGATRIQIPNTSIRDSVFDTSFEKKNLQFFDASEGCCKLRMLCIGNYGTGGIGKCSSLKHLWMGTADSTVQT